MEEVFEIEMESLQQQAIKLKENLWSFMERARYQHMDCKNRMNDLLDELDAFQIDIKKSR